MPPISHPPPPWWWSFVAASASAPLFLFLLLPTRLLSAAAQPASAPLSDGFSPSAPAYAHSKFYDGLVTVLVIVFLLSACTVYHYSPVHEGSTGRAVRLLRRLAAPRGLDPVVIETFPTVVYSATKGNKIGEESLECAVCLNDFEDDDTLRLIPKCNHAFHCDCIGAWLASHNTCPVCRADLASQPAGDSESQQGEVGTQPPWFEVTIEAAPPYASALGRSQRGGEREGIQPPEL